MPRKLLSKEQRKYFGKFPGIPSEEQLSEYFFLDDNDLAIIDELRTETNKLGFAIQLGVLRFIGTFPRSFDDVPYAVVEYVSKQLTINSHNFLDYFKKTLKNTRTNHINLIKERYGYQDFSSTYAQNYLTTWLENRLLLSNERPSVIVDLFLSKCVNKKIVLPGVTVFERFIISLKEKVESQILQKLAAVPSSQEVDNLLKLLNIPAQNTDDKQLMYRLEDLRLPLESDSQKEISRGISRVKQFNQFDIEQWFITEVPESKIQYYARIGADTRIQHIKRMPKERQIAVLTAYIYHYRKVALDELVTIFMQYLNTRFKRVKFAEEKERLRTLHDLDTSANQLMRAASYLLDDNLPDNQLREMIFSKISKEELAQAVAKVNRITSNDKDPIAIVNLLNYYSTVKRFLPDLLELFSLNASVHGEKIVYLWEFLKKQDSNKLCPQDYQAIKDFLPTKWTKYGEKNPSQQMKVVVFATLEQLVPALKRHDVFLDDSIKYSNPLDSLFSEEEWPTVRQSMAEKLELPINVEPLLEEVAASLQDSYQKVINTWETNNMCRIEISKGKERLVLKNIEKALESESAIQLRKEIARMLPLMDVPDLLLETNQELNFTDSFTQLTDNDTRMSDFHITMNAVLLSEACNIGLAPVTKGNTPVLTKDRLVWAKHNYLRPETIAEANNTVVAAHNQLPLTQYFGNGDIASADGFRLSLGVRSIHAGANGKYFGDKGITYYNFVSDQYSGFHGLVIPGTERDSLYVLEGLLEQTSPLDPSQIMTDTGGYSDMVFGLFALLGYQFSPRIKDSGSSRLWRMNKEANYGPLDSLSQNKINTKLIVKHWDEILNVVSSLRLGRMPASELIRTLQRDGNPSSLGRAIISYGRIFKTIHLLRYYSDEAYCRQILIQLNRGESRHTLCRAICYGKKGKIYKKYKIGQEETLGALGLVTNLVIYWNTVYMQAALIKLKEEGYPIIEEDLYHLSPLLHEHINFVGKYNFHSKLEISGTKLRALNPSTYSQEKKNVRI
ncbi:Tn3 family transposase [Enterococcus faecalis]|uniref:Tn3 family transposase n=1 Tax=Enterococcus faecalis TaxID=1351 RepID=UPI003D0A4FD5